MYNACLFLPLSKVSRDVNGGEQILPLQDTERHTTGEENDKTNVLGRQKMFNLCALHFRPFWFSLPRRPSTSRAGSSSSLATNTR